MATYDKTYHVKTQIRSDILANWLSANPVLLNGELAIVRFFDDEDTTALKVGNGWQNFSDLPYLYEHSLSLSDIVVDEATSAVTVFGRPLAFESSVPEVHDAALTIQRNGVDLTSFTANSDTPVSANIVVPTSTEDLTNNSGFATSSYVDGKFAVLSSIPTKVQELSSSLSSMSADIVEGLSNQVAPKLSSIADLVAAETQRVDDLSNDLSSYVKTIDNAVLSNTVSAIYEEVISAGTIISTEINPKLDLVSTLVSAEIESVNALRQGLSAYVTKTENESLSALANTIQSNVSALSSSLNNVAFTGSYTDLSNTPNGVLTINSNGRLIGTFSADQSSDVSIDIEVPLSVSQLENDLEYLLSSDSGNVRNVLPISAMPANSVNLTKNTYVYRVTDANGTGAFPAVVAPTDVVASGEYYFTFEIEWTTAAELASYSQTFDWINMPEMVQGSESHTYYITGRYDSGLSSYTMNCWRTK